MEEVLLLNPKRRTAARRAPSAAQKRARAAFSAMAKARSANPRRRKRKASRRRSNPIAPIPRARKLATMRAARRAVRSRRRTNPALPVSVNSLVATLKEGLIMGGGAIAVDVGYSYINNMLPANLRTTQGAVSAGNAIKAVVTVMLGAALSKATKGLSRKAALGALVVQGRDLVASMLPASMGGNAVAGLGYRVPAPVVNGNFRVGPNRTSMGAYLPRGQTPLLSSYMAPGATQLLSGRSAREREGQIR